MEIRKTRSSPRNPKCNGQVERFNRSLISMVKSYIKGEQTEWDLHLGILAGAYRSSPHESTGLTPNLLMLGREVRMPADITRVDTSTTIPENDNIGEYVLGLRLWIQMAPFLSPQTPKGSRSETEGQLRRQSQAEHL